MKNGILLFREQTILQLASKVFFLFLLLSGSALYGQTSPSSVDKVTIKDFYLGMGSNDVLALIEKLDKQRERGWNNCSSNTGSVVPYFDGLVKIETHLYDQACILWAYDLIGTMVDVTSIFHDDKLVWAEFKSSGSKLISSNTALIQALDRKYGKSKSFKYRDLFGVETGKKWSTQDAVIEVRTGTLIFQGVHTQRSLKSRQDEHNAKAGSVL